MRRERMITAVAALFVVVLLAAAGANAGTKAPLFSKSATQQGYGGVAPKAKPKKHISVAGTTHSSSNAAPLAAGHSGTLPFTGAQLGVFVALGLVLLMGGVVLHRAGRGRSRA